MALNFMIHCGGTEVERNTLAEVEVPATTRTYQPIRHDLFADLLQDKLADVGFRFGEEAHALNHEGQQYFGMAELKNGFNSEDWGLVAGWRSSYDKSMPAAFVVGSQVFVCDNLAFSGEVQIGRKHTTHILRDLPFLVEDAVRGTKRMAEQQVVRYDRYRQARMKDQVVNHAIIQMLRQNIITSSKVVKVVNEYYEPSHEEHGKGTNWTLFNATTEALKGSGLNNLPARTIKLHGLMDTATDWALAA